MDEKLFKKMNQKIIEIFENKDEIKIILESLKELSSENNSFAYGLVIGRLYNSFHYQCRRILNRNPTDEEFSEFMDLLKEQQSKLLSSLKL